MKYCKDCKYSSRNIIDKKYYCHHEKSIYNFNSHYKTMVEGENLVYSQCSDIRLYSTCGEQALLFEQKEKEGLIKRWLKNVFS